MTTLLAVQDPDEGTSEVATQTRELLQAWAVKHLPVVVDAPIEALSDSVIKSLRAEGASALDNNVAQLNRWTAAHKPASQFGTLLLAFMGAVRGVNGCYSAGVQSRELSYAVEGAAKEFTKRFFEQGMKWNLNAEWLAAQVWNLPHQTTGYQDRVIMEQLGCGERDIRNAMYIRGDIRDQFDGNMYTPDAGSESPIRFESIGPWLMARAEITSAPDREYWLRSMINVSRTGFQLHYMDADGPWVAGFLNLDDASRVRFRRIRLGAYLTELGYSDATVRSKVERAKQVVAARKFEAFPNDCLWDGVYTNGPSSCMSDCADDYETWDDIHPVSAYSAAYHGCGDNSLALIISRDDSGDISGRGILNLQRNSIVRWYGDAVAERVLLRNGVKVDDRAAMKGSWLAFMPNSRGTKFIRPYVDGDFGQGEVQGDRIVIGGRGLDLQCTSGSEYLGDTEYCIDTGECHDEDECTYQPHQGNYISDSCDDWRCPIIGEYSREYDRSYLWIHGVNVEVSDHVRYSKSTYLSECGFVGGETNYTIDDESVRRQFCSDYDVDEDADEDEDEEDAA